jgi:DMSO/TMAO reductase YedYZ molybdopterin-dependent catalytic subunit
LIQYGVASLTVSCLPRGWAAAIAEERLRLKPFITPAENFVDVTRGPPKPHELALPQRVEAGITEETWRLEITADPYTEYPYVKVPATIQKSLTLTDGTALDFPRLMEIARGHEVHFFKAMQCLNIEQPLGQGLWTGVPLSHVLKQCGKLTNVRRIYFWGYHFDDTKMLYKASVGYSQCMEVPPGQLPIILAYKLNGQPLSPERGCPVRMLVPWSHGFKSVKWLQHILLTNDHRNQDSYADGNNDVDGTLKTAAYLDKGPEKVAANQAIVIKGMVMSGPSGLKRVEYWVKPVEKQGPPMEDDDPQLEQAPWRPCELQAQPEWQKVLPAGIMPQQILGFDRNTGQPTQWPPPYCMCQYYAVIEGLKPGRYEIRTRSVDLNDFAQPEPRPMQKSGKNRIPMRYVEVA